MIPIQKFDSQLGISPEYIEIELHSTRTAADAAHALGTELGNILKSLVFIADDKPIVIFISGSKKANIELIKKQLGVNALRLANADEVKVHTGFSIGVVPPYGHGLKAYLDESLLENEYVFYATGYESWLAKIKPLLLAKACNAAKLAVQELSC